MQGDDKVGTTWFQTQPILTKCQICYYVICGIIVDVGSSEP